MTDWQLIVDKHGGLVWQIAYRLVGNHADAADCFQEAFVTAFEMSRRERVRNMKALLARLVTLRAIDKLRDRKKMSGLHVAVSDLNDLVSEGPAPEEYLKLTELSERLRCALGKLDEHEAEVFCLNRLNGLSYREIGRQIGITTNNVGVILHRAKTKLRALLEAEVSMVEARCTNE